MAHSALRPVGTRVWHIVGTIKGLVVGSVGPVLPPVCAVHKARSRCGAISAFGVHVSLAAAAEVSLRFYHEQVPGYVRRGMGRRSMGRKRKQAGTSVDRTAGISPTLLVMIYR